METQVASLDSTKVPRTLNRTGSTTRANLVKKASEQPNEMKPLNSEATVMWHSWVQAPKVLTKV